jgi:hypothetical protein
MAWVRLDDGFPYHPKAIRVGPYGRDLFTCGLCYANRFLTDGFIPEVALRQIAPGLPNPGRIVALLVSAALWEECEGGWRIHDYHEYQASGAEIRAAQERTRAIRSAGGRARAATAPRVDGRFAPAGDQQPAGGSAGHDGHQQHQQETSSAVPAATSTQPNPQRKEEIPYARHGARAGDRTTGIRRDGGNRKVVDPRVKELVEFWYETYRARFGSPPPVNGGEDGSNAKRLLAGRDLEEAKWLVREHLRNPPDFFERKRLYRLGHVLKAATTLLARRAEQREYRA